MKSSFTGGVALTAPAAEAGSRLLRTRLPALCAVAAMLLTPVAGVAATGAAHAEDGPGHPSPSAPTAVHPAEAAGHEAGAHHDATATTVAAATRDASAIRVLIDTSGSMKQNDPHNLRIAALRLLTGLVSPDVEAGAWLFGARTEPLVKPAAADEAWKERARVLAGRIHSRDAWTDIEQALERVTADWRRTAGDGGRAVLLLTDGVVDVSRDAAESAESRARILGPLADELAAAGIEVHSVALSEAADRELLEALARRTGGRSLMVAEAAALDRAFLHLLEGSAPREGLPMDGDALLVDDSVSEMTLLVFRSPDGPPLSLTTPGGERLEPPKLPKNVRWAREPAWDMVTIRRPQPGEWRMQASPDPDNRALVVSSLSLEIPPLPARLEAGGSVRIEARLLEDDRPIEREDFLDLLSLEATLAPADGQPSGQALERAPGEAAWQAEMALGERPQELELQVEVDGRTFRRQRRIPLTVTAPPLAAEFTGLAAGSEAFRLILEPPFEAAREGRVDVVVETPDGHAETLHGELADGRVEILIPRVAHGEYRLSAKAKGLDHAGIPFEQAFGPWRLQSLAPLGSVPSAPHPEAEAAVEAFDPNALVETDWTRVAWQVGLANLLAGIATWLVRRYLKQRAQRASAAWLMRVADAMA